MESNFREQSARGSHGLIAGLWRALSHGCASHIARKKALRAPAGSRETSARWQTLVQGFVGLDPCRPPRRARAHPTRETNRAVCPARCLCLWRLARTLHPTQHDMHMYMCCTCACAETCMRLSGRMCSVNIRLIDPASGARGRAVHARALAPPLLLLDLSLSPAGSAHPRILASPLLCSRGPPLYMYRAQLEPDAWLTFPLISGTPLQPKPVPR